MNWTVAHLSLPKLGECVCGDGALTRCAPTGERLFAVIDGLGHGPKAANATKAAMAWLSHCSLAQPLADIMQQVHSELRATRGAAGTLCLVRGAMLEGCAVGNVQLACAAPIPMILSAGVIGQRLPKLRVCAAELSPGTRLALFSDGISSKFRLEESRHLTPQQACIMAMERHRKKEDDSTILIADLEA